MFKSIKILAWCLTSLALLTLGGCLGTMHGGGVLEILGISTGDGSGVAVDADGNPVKV